MNEFEKNEFRNRIDRSLSALERYVCSVDPYTLILSYVSAVVPEIVRAFIWRRTPKIDDQYDLVYELPTLDKATPQELAETTPWKDSREGFDRFHPSVASFVRIPGVSAQQAVLENPIPTNRTSRFVRHAILVPYGEGEDDYEFILEVYFDGFNLVDGEKLRKEVRPKVELVLERMYPRIKVLADNYRGGLDHLEWGRIFEAALFDIVSRASRPPLNPLPGASHMFIYNAPDRFLYHRATNAMSIDSVRLPSYVAPAQALDPEFLAFVTANIDSLTGTSPSAKETLKKTLQNLGDKDRTIASAKERPSPLVHLLPLLPQEPGTGVAGYAAFAQIPQISNRNDEVLWDTKTYADPAIWFPVMLSIEKLFGVATPGEMFAVPLHEAGQLAGVFFVTPAFKRPDEATKPPEQEMLDNTLALIEMAAREAPVMTMYRTLLFHQAVVTSIYRDRERQIAELIAEHAPLAFNTPLTARWKVNTEGTFSVTIWGIDKQHTRYRRLSDYEMLDDSFHNAALTEIVKTLARADTLESTPTRTLEPVSVLERPEVGEEHRWGMPPGYIEEFEKNLGIRLRAALLVVPPSGRDAIVIYLENSGEVLRNNLPLIQRKLGVMQFVGE